MNNKIYIARDKDGTLAIYNGKPTYDEEFDTFDGDDNIIDYINSNLYPEVTFENSPVILKSDIIVNNNNKIIIPHRDTNITIKRNLFRLPIISVNYITSLTKDNKTKTSCIIDWYDPIYNIVRTSKTSTIRNPKDKPNDVIAKRIAESRCKMIIYYKYSKEVRNTLKTIKYKYNELICTEIGNQANLIKNL